MNTPFKRKSSIHLAASSISCGVRQFFNIYDSQYEKVDDQLFDAAQQIYNQSSYYTDDFGRSQRNPGGVVGDAGRPYVGNCAFFVFSHNGSGKNACQTIMDRVHELKLGECWASESSINPNSMNNIIVYVWRLDQKAYKKWWYERHQKEEKERLAAEKKAEQAQASKKLPTPDTGSWATISGAGQVEQAPRARRS